MSSTANELVRSPDIFPHSLDPLGNAVYVVAMNAEAYRSASFLDQRSLTQGQQARWISWPELAEASAALPVTCGLIFHIGHVGSTLLSRLLGDWPGLFAVREPAAFRTIAELSADRDLADCPWPADKIDLATDRLLGLWSRTYAPAERSIVKATSFVSEMAESILARQPQVSAIGMTLSPESYLPVIFGGDASRAEIRAMVRQRLRRLNRRLGGDVFRLHTMSEGEWVAMSWLTETMSLEAAARPAGARMLRVDFDAMLRDPETTLQATARHFGAADDISAARALAGSDHMRRYSKAQEHSYSADLRQQVIDDARVRHGVEIRSGLAWLDRATKLNPDIARAIAFAAGH